MLPVGGIKEKLIAAHRAGVKRVILPADNRRDTVGDGVAEQVKRDVELICVGRLAQALPLIFDGFPEMPHADNDVRLSTSSHPVKMYHCHL